MNLRDANGSLDLPCVGSLLAAVLFRNASRRPPSCTLSLVLII